MSESQAEPRWWRDGHHPKGLAEAWREAVAFNVEKTHYVPDPDTQKPFEPFVSNSRNRGKDSSGLDDFDLSVPRAVLRASEACALFERLSDGLNAKQWVKLLALAGSDDRLRTILAHIAAAVAEFELEKGRTEGQRREDTAAMGKVSTRLAKDMRALGFAELTVTELLNADELSALASDLEAAEHVKFSDDPRTILGFLLPRVATLLERIGKTCEGPASEWRLALLTVSTDGKRHPRRAHLLRSVYAILTQLAPETKGWQLMGALADAANGTHASELLTPADVRALLGIKK